MLAAGNLLAECDNICQQVPNDVLSVGIMQRECGWFFVLSVDF